MMEQGELDFQKIHEEYRPRIQRYLASLVGEFDAEDLTQDVFMRISRALPGFRGESQLKTWIYRIATNAALDWLRKPAQKQSIQQIKTVDPESGCVEEASGEIWPVEAAHLPEQEVFFTQEVDCYREYLKKLPENYQAVVILNQVGEYTAKEIADILGLSVDTVKIRLHRGKARLLKELKAHCKPEDWL